MRCGARTGRGISESREDAVMSSLETDWSSPVRHKIEGHQRNKIKPGLQTAYFMGLIYIARHQAVSGSSSPCVSWRSAARKIASRISSAVAGRGSTTYLGGRPGLASRPRLHGQSAPRQEPPVHTTRERGHLHQRSRTLWRPANSVTYRWRCAPVMIGALISALEHRPERLSAVRVRVAPDVFASGVIHGL